MNILRVFSSFILIFACLVITGCATVYESACHELSVKNKSQLSSMVRGAKRANFERHVVLLETGTAMTSQCKSHYIDRYDYENLPDSLRFKCELQSEVAIEKYCTLYSLNGKIIKQDIE